MRKTKLTTQTWMLLALVLLFVVNLISYLKVINFSLTSLQVEVKSPIGPDPFYKGKILSLDYKSRYSNFGSVEIRFNTYDQISTDSLEFRIKEQGQSNWYYRAEYKVDQFQNNKLFPFGFPIINESENRTYHIEIESQRGVVGDLVALSEISPQIVSKHVFGRKLLFSNPQLLFDFIFQKTANIIQFPEFLASFVVFAIPLLVYLLYLIISFGVGLFSFILYILIVIEIFWIQRYYSYLQLSIVFGWFLMMRKHRLTYMVPALVGMFLFVLMLLSHIFGFEALTGKFGAWTFWFFCLASFQSGREIFVYSSRPMSLLQYWKNIYIEVWNTFLIAWLMAIGQVTLTAKTSKTNNGKAISWRKLSAEEYGHRVSLIVKRFEAPMIETFLITSRFISSLILTIVTLLNYSFRFGPYLASVWLVRLSIKNLSSYANFFQSFFVTSQSEHYWHSIGYYLVFVHLFAALIFLISQRKKNLRVKTYYLVATLLIALNVSHTIFDLSTVSYREKPTIWGIKPDQAAEPWVDVTIVGRNFGEKPFDGVVHIGGVEQRIMDWKNNEIIFRTDPIITRTGILTIKTRREESSNPIMFNYTGNR